MQLFFTFLFLRIKASPCSDTKSHVCFLFASAEAGRCELDEGGLLGFFEGIFYYVSKRNAYTAEEVLAEFGIDGRWDLITPELTRYIAGNILEHFAEFWKDPAAVLGYDPF